MYVQCCVCRIQTERQERKRAKQEFGLVDESGRKTRFDPPEPVASGVSLGIAPLPAGTAVVPPVVVLVTRPSVGMQSVRLFVCKHISKTTCPIFLRFLCMLPMAVTRFFSGDTDSMYFQF